jgi:hypothetical protein
MYYVKTFCWKQRGDDAEVWISYNEALVRVDSTVT